MFGGHDFLSTYLYFFVFELHIYKIDELNNNYFIFNVSNGQF